MKSKFIVIEFDCFRKTFFLYNYLIILFDLIIFKNDFYHIYTEIMFLYNDYYGCTQYMKKETEIIFKKFIHKILWTIYQYPMIRTQD